MGNSTSSCETCDYPIYCFNTCLSEIQRKNNRKNIKYIQIIIEYVYYQPWLSKYSKWKYTIKNFKQVKKYLKIYNSTFSCRANLEQHKMIDKFIKNIFDQNTINLTKYQIKENKFNNNKFFIIEFKLEPELKDSRVDSFINNSAIRYASENGHLEVVKELLNNLSPDEKEPSAPLIDLPPSYEQLR